MSQFWVVSVRVSKCNTVATLVEIFINEQIAIANMCIVDVRINPVYNNMFEMPSDSISECVFLFLKIFWGACPKSFLQ